ncbi:MAG TPA: sugar ABC transporter ATP-binding protein [Aggregatilineales bacterium]|nr:sugar ABC transporter ATP-binding protein [Aggregatilineales bacterium]
MALLQLDGVSKSFSGVQALHGINLTVEAGEVHALIGENGAGKSTLIKLLGGVYTPDEGTIRFNGEAVHYSSPHEAKLAGIHTLYQEFNLLPQQTGAENIGLGSEPHTRFLPLIDWNKMRSQARDILAMLGLTIDPNQRVCYLSVAEQQMVELAKMMHAQPRLLLMDEPTASLSQREVNALFALIRHARQRGIGIVYISHRLNEIMDIADRATVLRDGRRVITVRVGETTPEQLIRLMLGKAVNSRFSRPARIPGPEMLRVENLTRRAAFQNVSFELHAGEIVGLAGLVGSGRTALVRAIFGLDMPDSGTIYVEQRPVSIRTPRDAVNLGMGLLPEDRHEQALLLDMSTRENISLAKLGQAHSSPIIDMQSEQALADRYIRKLRIKTPSADAKTRFLSGGTQQKIVLSRWLAAHPRILIFDEPTRGIDVGAKIEIYRMMGELAAQGIAILMISSELPEIVGLCDRALVMRSGRLIMTLNREHITEEALLSGAMGDSA